MKLPSDSRMSQLIGTVFRAPLVCFIMLFWLCYFFAQMPVTAKFASRSLRNLVEADIKINI